MMPNPPPTAAQRAKEIALEWFQPNCEHTVDDYEVFKQECVEGCLVKVLTTALTRAVQGERERCAKMAGVRGACSVAHLDNHPDPCAVCREVEMACQDIAVALRDGREG